MRLVLFGPPGAGKGTQAARIAAAWGVPHVCTGAMLREAVRIGSALGRRISDVIARGELAPDELVAEVVAERIRRDDARRGFLLDGFPRALRQVELLDRMLNGAGLDRVLVLDAPDEVALQRLMGRAVTGNGGELRADDNQEAARRRLAIYHAQAAPVLDAYGKRGILARVDGVGTPDEVFRRVTAALGALAE